MLLYLNLCKITSIYEQIEEMNPEIEKLIKDFVKKILLLQAITGVGKEETISIMAEMGCYGCFSQ